MEVLGFLLNATFSGLFFVSSQKGYFRSGSVSENTYWEPVDPNHTTVYCIVEVLASISTCLFLF
jgi:hypothetical protein